MKLREKTIAELNFVISDGKESYLREINGINEYFLSLVTPKNLDGGSKDNVAIQFQVQFSELCIGIMTNGIPDPEKMTVFKFYSTMKYFEDKQRKHKK